MKSTYALITGPDCYHWQHNTVIFNSYKAAMVEYQKTGGTESAVIVRMDDDRWTPGRRTVKRQNQFNYGHAAAWCDAMNARNFSPVFALPKIAH